MRSKPTPAAVSDALWARLVLIRQLVSNEMQGGLTRIGGLDLSVPQSTVLFQIAENEPLTVSALQARIGRSQGATSHLVSQLELKGLVARGRDGDDARRTAIRLTRQGRQLVKRVEDLRREAFERLLGRVPPDVLRRFDAAMKEVLDSLEVSS